MEIKLKPCPFCGGEAELLEGCYSEDGLGDRPWVVRCKSCDTRKVQRADWCSCNPYRKPYGECEAAMRNAVVEAWNTRAERTCRMVKPEWAGPKSRTKVCSECGVQFETWLEKFCSNCGAKVVER